MAPWVSRMCLAIPMWDSGASKAASVGVLMILAPRPFKTSTFSLDIFSGRVIMISYPLVAAARESPIPVFPEVASIIVSPFFSLPLFSASTTILLPIRSYVTPKLTLTEPPMFMNSHLARNSHSDPLSTPTLLTLIIGVFPMASSTSL
jgi:hypothetical protein